MVSTRIERGKPSYANNIISMRSLIGMPHDNSITQARFSQRQIEKR
jgi:hypothetical protein